MIVSITRKWYIPKVNFHSEMVKYQTISENQSSFLVLLVMTRTAKKKKKKVIKRSSQKLFKESCFPDSISLGTALYEIMPVMLCGDDASQKGRG